MSEFSPKVVSFPQESGRHLLEEVLRRGARELLAQAIEQEVAEYLSARSGLLDAEGRRQVVRNGYLPGRELQTPLGGVAVQQPRVRDRRDPGEREVFHSKL